MKGSDHTWCNRMVDKNNWRFHTANKYFIKNREYLEKVFWSKDWAQFLSDFILSDYRNLDRLSSCEMTDLFTLKLAITLHWNDCVCWHQPSRRKRTKILARQIFLFSNKFILWGMQVDKTASGLKDAKKRGRSGYDCIYQLILFNGVRSSLQSYLYFWVSRCESLGPL